MKRSKRRNRHQLKQQPRKLDAITLKQIHSSLGG